MVVVIDAKFDETENALDVELSGDEMGVLTVREVRHLIPCSI